MRSIRQTAAFKKDFKRVSKGSYRLALKERFLSVVMALANDETLSSTWQDHALVGNWKGHRECHVSPDLLLLYYKNDAYELVLERLGSHSEIFGK